MIKTLGKGLVVAVVSAIALPYTVAILCNVLYGWPKKNKFQRAFHPRKVYNLNYTVLQHLMRIKYIGLLMRWKCFYKKASGKRLIKDIVYGSNENALDIYFPNLPPEVSTPRPVVLFVYGGSWSSGDKSMYGLLCAQVADRLKAIVCCMNYSTYPQGYVDDMVQDVADCLSWLQGHIAEYGGNKNQVILLGHSAGAHLCLMSVLELTMNRIHHDPGVIISQPPMSTSSRAESFQFEEDHFDRSSEEEEVDIAQKALSESQSAPMSFYVPANGSSNSNEDNGNKLGVVPSPLLSRGSSIGSDVLSTSRDSSFFVVRQQDTELIDQPIESSDENEKQDVESQEKSIATEAVPTTGLTDTAIISEPELKDRNQDILVDKGDDATDLNKEDESIFTETVPDSELLTKSQREVRDILASVKAVIGLAGVYDIADHYEHEASRGIEDVSNMHRAMYGPEHFNRFSPTHIVANMPEHISLPYIHLIHGNTDKIVPMSSTVKFADAANKTATEVNMNIITECNHLEICLDLMTSKAKHFYTVMDCLTKTAQKVFH